MDNSHLKKIFGEIIKELRLKNNLSQDDLALKSKLDRTHISRLESGKYEPKLLTLLLLSKGFDMDFSDLSKLIEKRYQL